MLCCRFSLCLPVCFMFSSLRMCRNRFIKILVVFLKSMTSSNEIFPFCHMCQLFPLAVIFIPFCDGCNAATNSDHMIWRITDLTN